MVRVLFVCMGNICRSPTAQGVFERWVERTGLQRHIEIDSAGTHAYHVGEAPDRRSQAAAKNRGFDLSQQRARRINAQDFQYYDYVLAMDTDNYAELLNVCPAAQQNKIALFLDYADKNQTNEKNVPDPYYGGNQGFENVLDLVELAAQGLLSHIQKQHDF